MNAAGKIFVKTYLKAIKDTFFSQHLEFLNICVIFLSNGREKYKLLGLQADPPPQFSRLVGHPDLSMRKTLRVVGLLTVKIFFQSKHLTESKVKDEKEEIIFYF